MRGMEGAIVALLLQLVMVATELVANAWDGGCHCCPPLAVGHGCNWACGQSEGWRAPLSPSSCSWSWLQLGLWPKCGMEGAIVAFYFKEILEKWFKVDVQEVLFPETTLLQPNEDVDQHVVGDVVGTVVTWDQKHLKMVR
jgi:hypothetical protein